MNKQAYIAEVSALRAPERLRGRIAVLPSGERTRAHNVRPYGRWMSIAAALVLVVGLGAATPAFIGYFTTGGDITTPPSVSTSTPVPAISDPWGIQLSAENITPTGLTLVCQQSGGQPTGELTTGRPFWIEQYTDGQWKAVDMLLENNAAWTMEGLSISMNSTQKWAEGWERLYGALSPGEYRIAKTITDHRGPGDNNERTYYAEFTIGSETASVELLGTAIDQLDYAKLEGQMDAGDWADLQEYLPVLRDGVAFRWVREEETEQAVTLDEFYRQRFSPDVPDGKLDLERFTLFGFEGTGKQDLILCFYNFGGNYLILHREGQEFYGFERSYRSFEQLQRDGMFIGSSGASYNSYYRMRFQNGAFEEELLGEQVGETYEIGGQAVSAGYFWTWRQNCMMGDMYWYYPAQPTGKKPPPSTEDERRYHISISGLPLEEPFLSLPEGLLATLEDTGNVEDWAVTQPERAAPWIMKTYRSSSLEVQTLMVPAEILEQLLAEGTFTQEQYDAALGTEYVYTARALDRSYPTGSGLRLGDSAERARDLFYDVPDDGETVLNAGLATLTVTTENGVVTGLLSCSGGRTVGEIMY